MARKKKSDSPKFKMTEEAKQVYRARLRLQLFTELRALFRRRQRETGLTQNEVADRLGVDDAVISKRLNGEANLTLNTVSDLARAMEGLVDVKITAIEDFSHHSRVLSSWSDISDAGEFFAPRISSPFIPQTLEMMSGAQIIDWHTLHRQEAAALVPAGRISLGGTTTSSTSLVNTGHDLVPRPRLLQ